MTAEPDDEHTVAMALPTLPPPTATQRPTADKPPVETSQVGLPVRPTGPPRRPPMIVQGLWPALVAGGLALATVLGPLPLAVAVVGLQLFLVLGALALLDAPAAGGAFFVTTAAALAADAVVLIDDGRTSGLAGVIGLTLAASLLHQLVRSSRNRVTESLADTLLIAVAVVGASCLLALPQLLSGDTLLLVSLAAAAAALLVGRLGDAVAGHPVLAAGATRGWPGLAVELAAGTVAAIVAGRLAADAGAATLDLPIGSAALIGLVVAATVATADLVVDLGAVELRRGWRDARRAAALRPTALLLPYALLGPVVLLAGRLVLP